MTDNILRKYLAQHSEVPDGDPAWRVDEACECLNITPEARAALLLVAPDAYGDRPVSLEWALAILEQDNTPYRDIAAGIREVLAREAETWLDCIGG